MRREASNKTICALTIGAQQGFIYLRGEYRYLQSSIEAALVARRRAHLLGRDVLGHRGFNFNIALHLGVGAYVCGEESALIESLEGKRGIPRNRPRAPVPETFVIAIKGTHFALGDAMSQDTETHLSAALDDFADRLERWERRYAEQRLLQVAPGDPV